MELRELVRYAKENYNISEQYKWREFPGFSVLIEPTSQKWVALLMRQWNTDAGETTELCDIKCGDISRFASYCPWVGAPFRMKGWKWHGVKFGAETDAELVFGLFDLAIADAADGFTVTLCPPERNDDAGGPIYKDTKLPPPPPAGNADGTPQMIREMKKLYVYGDMSFKAKCRNFYTQAKFMEDYVDNVPWTGDHWGWNTVYHDLSTRQLRGYFTWRAQARQGIFDPIPESVAMMYVYEILCGIGVKDPADGLRRLREFNDRFRSRKGSASGAADSVALWMEHYAVVNDIPREIASKYLTTQLTKDGAHPYFILRDADVHTDDEVFKALNSLYSDKLDKSSFVRQDPEKAKAMFAGLWRSLLRRKLSGSGDRANVLSLCFGAPRALEARMFEGAIRWSENDPQDLTYSIDPFRTYVCRGGRWTEYYLFINNGNQNFVMLMHEADRVFRDVFGSPHKMKPNDFNDELVGLIEEFANEAKQAEIEAARPKIEIDASHLEKIRVDAAGTRDSLLVEPEEEESVPAPPEPAQPEEAAPPPDEGPEENVYMTILRLLLEGRPVDGIISEKRLMPSVVADAINEMMFDEIGDCVVECDGSAITLAEEYRDDLAEVIGIE